MNNFLSDFLGSRSRAAILQKLFGMEQPELHLRELERQTELAIGTIQQEMKRLINLELVRGRRDGNRLYYEANTAHPCYQDIHNLVIKSTGLIPLLKEVLSREDVTCAFIFGSFARGEQGAASDVDLMVVGDLGLRKLASLLTRVSNVTNREINPHVMKISEFIKRVSAKDHFLMRVLEGRKIFIIGSEHELETMGG